MSDLIDFARRLEIQLAHADRQPHWEPGEADRYMNEVGMRRKRFQQVASQLNNTVVQSRLETLASYFANAKLLDNEPIGNCSCWFGYCERFPASTKVAFSIQHPCSFRERRCCIRGKDDACVHQVQ